MTDLHAPAPPSPPVITTGRGRTQHLLDRCRTLLGTAILFGRALRRCFFGMLAVSVILAFFMLVPQGKETLLLVVDDAAASQLWGMLLVLSAAALATIVWYSSRVLMDIDRLVPTNLHSAHFGGVEKWLDRWVPRILGALCILPLVFFIADSGVDSTVLASPLLVVAAFALLAAIEAKNGCVRCRLYRWGFLISFGFVLVAHRWAGEFAYGDDHTASVLLRRLFSADGTFAVRTTGVQVLLALVGGASLEAMCRRLRTDGGGNLAPELRTSALLRWIALTVAAIAAWLSIFWSVLLPRTGYLVLFTLIVAVLLISFFVYRRDWFPSMMGSAAASPAPLREHAQAEPGGQHDVEVPRTTFWLLGLALVAALLIFAVVWWNPIRAGRLLGTPALLLLALAVWVVFGAVVLTIVPNSWRLPSFALLPLIVASCNMTGNAPITVSTVPVGDPDARPTFTRPAVQDALRAWIDNRQERKTGPIYVVAAAGGGIRAAYLTASYLAAADDASNGEFGKRVFVISAVSGGSLGATTYALLRAPEGAACADPSTTVRDTQAALAGTRIGPRQRAVACMLEQDFLSPTVGTFLFPDLLRAIWVPPFLYRVLNWQDRGRTLEQAWAASADVLDKRTLTGRFLDYAAALETPSADRSRDVHLIFNSTGVQSGQRVLASTFKWEALSAIDLFDKAYDTAGVSLVGATHNSARFTYMSPAAAYFRSHTDGQVLAGQLADGGYFDNSGGLSLLEIMQQLSRSSPDEAKRIRVIVITNDGNERRICDMGEPSRVTGDVQVTAPLTTFLATRSARAELSKEQLKGELALLHGKALCNGDGKRPTPLDPLVEVSLNNVVVADFLQKEMAAAAPFSGDCDKLIDVPADEQTRAPNRTVAVRIQEAPLGWALSSRTTRWLTRYARHEGCKAGLLLNQQLAQNAGKSG